MHLSLDNTAGMRFDVRFYLIERLTINTKKGYPKSKW